MRTTLQIPHPRTALHIYRHLLREATYLPTIARGHIHSHIQTIFRRRRRALAKTDLHIREAHKCLASLRAAVSGDRSSMEHVLHLATGRVAGRRHRELSRTITNQRAPATRDELERALGTRESGSNAASNDDDAWRAKLLPTKLSRQDQERVILPALAHRSRFTILLEKWDLPQVLGWIRAQRKREAKARFPYTNTVASTEDPYETVPLVNAWGKTPHWKIVRNKIRNYFWDASTRLAPPVGKAEWDTLAALAHGKELAGIDPVGALRRPLAVSPGEESASGTAAVDELTWKFAIEPARRVERFSSRRQMLRTGAVTDDPRGPLSPIGGRRHTKESMQKLYRSVWEITPYAVVDPRTSRLIPVWGGNDGKAHPPRYHEHVFFEGIGDDGRLEKSDQFQPKKRKSNRE